MRAKHLKRHCQYTGTPARNEYFGRDGYGRKYVNKPIKHDESMALVDAVAEPTKLLAELLGTTTISKKTDGKRRRKTTGRRFYKAKRYR